MRYWFAACALVVAWAVPARSQDLAAFCKAQAGKKLGLKDGKTVPITCDSIQTMAEWFPVPALGAGYVQALKTLGGAKFASFYNNPKDASLRLVCAPNLEGYLCTFPLGPAELLIGPNGIVRAISKTISKDGPDYQSVMTNAAHELGIDSLSDNAMTLAMDIEADAIKAGAGKNVDVTRTPRAYIYLFHP